MSGEVVIFIMGICVGIILTAFVAFGLLFAHFYSEALKDQKLIYDNTGTKEKRSGGESLETESGEGSKKGTALDRILVGSGD